MAAKAHKKQHYVPQCYLTAWCDPMTPSRQEPYVWLFSTDGATAKRKAPSNIFHETDFYTVKGPNGTRDLTLERGLAELESLFVNVRRDKIEPMKPLTAEDHFVLCAFAAAMLTRTKGYREHLRGQYGNLLDMMGKVWDQKAKGRPRSESASIAEVEALVEAPTQKMLAGLINSQVPLLLAMDFGILRTDTEPGFITSDCPCVWFDPKARERPFPFNAPGLAYETIEIRLPLSPTRALFLNRCGLRGYIVTNDQVTDEANRMTRCFAHEHFVVNTNTTNPYWFVLDPRKGTRQDKGS